MLIKHEFAEIKYFENFPPAFFIILKEPLIVQKQTIPQKKALILSFLEHGRKKVQ